MAELTFKSGMKLLSQKNYQTVYDEAVKALRQNEKNPLAFFFLGIVATDNGQPGKALEFFGKASEHEARNARYQAYHAKAHITLGQLTKAKLRADQAAKIKTDDAFVSDIIGTVYSRAGYHQLAIPLFKRAVKLNPNWPIFQFNLGASAQFIGDIKTAKSAYKKAVTLDPKFYRAWFALVSLTKQTLQDNQLETLKQLFEDAGPDANAQSLLGHAITKTLEDLDKYPESLDWLHKAKHLQKNRTQHNQREVRNIFDAAKLSGQSVGDTVDHESGITPIFIVGLPRTGTTLLDRILSSHPKVTSAGELDLFAHLIREKTGRGTSAMFEVQTFLAAQKMNLKDIGVLYRQHIATISDSAQQVIDKTPLNFFYAGLIHRALPDARIIALRRGAMDTCLSNYRQLFALGDSRYTYALDLENTAAFYREFDGLMAHWRDTLPESRFMEIRYEDIVHNQETQTRRLLSVCGLDWDAACMQFHENAAPVDTASSVQVRQPLYAGSIDRWKKYGDRLETLKSALGNLADT